MASIIQRPNGHKWVQFVATDRKRRTVRLGKCSLKVADTVRHRVECLLSSMITGTLDRDTSLWVADMTERNPELRSKLEAVGLLTPLEPPATAPLLTEFLDSFVERAKATKKPGTLAVWRQVIQNLKDHMPEGIRLDEVTVGHAKDFHTAIQAKGMKPTTIFKRIQFCRQFFNDAVDREIISKNPFAKVKAVGSSPKSNVFVDRDAITKVMKVADPVWEIIIALSRFGGLRCPSEVLSLKWDDIDWDEGVMHIPEPKCEHHVGRGRRACPIFTDLRPFLDAAWERAEDNAEFVVAKQAYRDAANTGDGWKNANLRTQFAKLLAKAKVPEWGRLFHSMRASRQTELEREFPIHVVCSWIGNSPTIAQKSYLLVTKADFARASQREALSEAVEIRTDGEEQEKPEALCEAVTVGKAEYPEEENLENPSENSVLSCVFSEKSAEDTGFEPATPYGALHFQ
jgi:integrase